MKNNYLKKTKTIVVLLGIWLACFASANANPVDSERARQVAANFLNINRSADLIDISAEAGFTNVYVFTTEKSFVLLAADDRVQPILGYSLNGHFDVENMPDNKRAWIQEYSDAIQHVVDKRMSATSEVTQQWRDLAEGHLNRSAMAVVVSPLLQTTWDQDDPYNYLCPASGNVRAVTGCVATAMAQVMKYWNYPTRGIGTHTYTHANFGEQSANFQNTTYNWSNMLNSYSSGYSSAQRNAVATLMYHCGVSVDMDYGTESSGASTGAVADALKSYFGYSKDVHHYSRSRYSDSDWIAMLKADLDQSRPIQYHGSGSGGGHSFVCDGYNSSNYFHFNWGWSGYCDEYYTVNNLNPGPGGIGSGSFGVYNDSQGAVMGIHPSSNTSTPPSLNHSISGTAVNLSWTSVSGATDYYIYRDGYRIATTTSTSYTVSHCHGTMSFYVRSVNSAQELSTSSNIVTVTIPYVNPVVDNLEASLTDNNVTLTWSAPDWCYPSSPTATVTIGNGVLSGSSLGYNNGNNIYWGHRYLASSLSSYNNKTIYKVSFYTNEGGSYQIHILNGTNTYSSGVGPQTKLCEQTVSVPGTGWHDVDLTTPIVIDASKDYWVFIYDPEGRDYPASYANYSGSDGNYYSSNIYSYIPNTYSGVAFLIRAFVTDGTYTYTLYRNGSSIANNVSNTTYTDSNLSPGTYTYYLKTNYYAGESDQSNTATVIVGQEDVETLTVYEGTSTTNTVPAYIFYFDQFTKSQFVIPANDLVEMIGAPITSMTFYTTSFNVPYTTESPADVYLKEVNYTSISTFEPKSSATIVYSGYFDIVSADNGGKMTINFSTPYTYQGGDLLIGIENTQRNSYINISFQGQTVNGASISGYNVASLDNVHPAQRDFIPKTTFGFIPACETKTLPYTYGFEDPEEFDCWTKLNCHSSSAISNNAAYEGGYGFRFHWSTNPPQYLISPKFEGTTGMNVSFYYRNDSDGWTETFQVGYSTTTKSPNAFIWSEEVTAHDQYTWMLYEDFFPEGTKYVAVKLTSNDQYYLLLDNFSVVPAYCAQEDQCKLIFTLSDAYGDGWNDAAINVIDVTTNTCLTTMSATDHGLSNTTTTDTFEFFVCDGRELRFEWVSGSWDGECSYTVTYSNGNEIFAGSDMMSDPFTFTVNCGGSEIQTIPLSAGWNWFSTYISGEPTELLQMLENGLGENGIVIKSNAVSTDYYDDYGWYGDLDDEGLMNGLMYMIQTNAACTVELEGVPANPAEVSITIHHGWNWIGYPCAEAMSVADALAGFQAKDGDILKNSEASTDYYEGFGWYGELETMEPGQGFMYYSNSQETKTLIFTSNKGSKK